MTTKTKPNSKAKGSRNGCRPPKLGLVPISSTTRCPVELGLVPISDAIDRLPLSGVRPSPENDKLYKPVNPIDPDFKALVESVKKNGVTEALTVTRDRFIISGHRRYAAATVARLATVPCRTADIDHDDPRFLPLLREANRQRVKTLDEVLREEVVSADPKEAHRALREHREQLAMTDYRDTIVLGRAKRRSRITKAKRPLLDAILSSMKQAQRGKLSVRQIFYVTLNANPPPLVHASKPDSAYRNDDKCYKAVDDLCVRARLTGEISFDSIHDPTRPVITWNVFAQPAPFLRSQLDSFLKGYYRDLMQSQPNHIEIVGEKNTIAGIIRPVAMDYTIPYTIGRGYSSLPPRHDMAVRFRRSGKEKLILLVLSDFDPEGEDIGRSFAQSMRDDFGIESIVPVKVALTAKQVADLNLPPNLTAKTTSSRRKGFVAKHGENVFELEAIPPATLQQFLRDAINTVIDVAAYNAEIEAEKEDAGYIEGVRRKAHLLLGNLGDAGEEAKK